MYGIAYVYDDDGYYIGPTPVQESPLEPGVWLLPGKSVFTAPPALSVDERARFVDSEWVIERVAKVSPEPVEKVSDDAVLEQQLEAYLRQTDWYAVRRSETGKPVPDDITLNRASARERISLLRSKL